MSFVQELRNKKVDELRTELLAKRAELIELQRTHAAGELANPRQLTKIRREIAQVATVIAEANAQSTQENV